MSEDNKYVRMMSSVSLDTDGSRIEFWFDADDGSGDVKIGIADKEMNYKFVTFKNGMEDNWLGPVFHALMKGSKE